MCADRRRCRLAGLSGLLLASLACESVLGPSSLDGDWIAHRSTHFTLQVRPGSFADENAATLIGVLEDQYGATIARLDLAYAGQVTGVLFPSAAEAGRLSDRSGTGYPETESFKAVCTPPLDGGLFSLLAHEANHVILWVSLGRSGTTLMREGLPSAVISERYHSDGPSFLYGWTVRNASRLPPIADLANDDAWDGYPQDVAYNTSASFLAYLIEIYGPDPLKRLHGATSNQFVQRFEDAYGRPLSQAETEWKAFCAARVAGR
jgi:hypothetical protein